MKYLISFFLSLWILTPLSAQWESMNGPYGGSINDLAQNDNYQFAATSNGIYRSGDEGQTWHHLNLASDKSFACLQIGIYGNIILTDAANYAGAKVNRYLFRSEDNGETWQQLNRPEANWPFYLSIALNSSHIYVADQTDLWVSLDNGVNWNLSQINPAIDYIWSMHSYNDHIYVNAGTELYKSNGLFDDFNTIQFGDFGYAFSFFASDSLYLAEGGNGNLYRSVDGGLTWSNPLNELDGYVSFSSYEDAIYINNSSTIFKSNDQGLTWTDQKSKFFSQLTHTMIATETKLLSGSFYTGIQTSKNEGKTFEESNFGISACFTQSLVIHNNKLFTGSVSKGISGFNLQSETWDSSHSLNILADISDISSFGGSLLAIAGSKLFKSTNAGLSWIETTPFGISNMPFTFFHFYDLILAGGTLGSSMIISNNNGDSWMRYQIKVDGIGVTNTHLFATNDETRFVAKRKVLFRSDDLSTTWDTSMNGLILEDIYSFIDKLYAFGDTIIILEINETSYNYTLNISFDNGHNWQAYDEGLPMKEHFSGIKSITKVGQILLGCMYDAADGVYVSFNNGIHWQPFNDGLLLGGVYEIIHDDTYLYAATSGQGVWRRKISDLHTVSTNPSPAPPEISIYPNPTNGNIWLEMESLPATEASLIISTVQGQVMLSEKIFLDSRTEINTDQLPSGTYILTVKAREQVFSNKFIINK